MQRIVAERAFARRPRAFAGRSGPRGLGGWLTVIVIAQFAAMARVVGAIAGDIELHRQLHGQMLMAAGAEIALYLAFLALIVRATMAMFSHRRIFPLLWKAQAVLTVFFPLLDALLVAACLEIPANGIIDETMMNQVVATAIAAAVWFWYMSASERVRNTFVN